MNINKNGRFLIQKPITQKEFDKLLLNIKPKYKEACKDIYLYGEANLEELSKKYKFNKRSFQRQLEKFGYCFMNLKYGYIGLKLSQGYTIESIRKSMGYSIRRNDLNKVMWDKIRGDVSPGMRWRILKRDGFRCIICGADATDRKLHLDHIIPICEGGKSKINNLRVLCSKCNLGRNIDLKDIKNNKEKNMNQ